MERLVTKTNPKLFDKLFAEIQNGLATQISWLDHIFGKAERLAKVIKGKRYFTPNIYRGRNEYTLIAPDSGFGNYSFFTLEEPQTIGWNAGERSTIKAPFSLIVWVDMRTIDDQDERNTEAVKQEILRALNGGILLREGRITINKVYERAENVFEGFTLDEIDNQYLMQPFAGFRFTGEIQIEDECI